MVDFSIYESGNGGDLLIVNDDIALADSLLQLVYLCLFGGNIESSTNGNERPNELRSDWWANSLLFGVNRGKQFNSLTERTLKNTPLSSSGRVAIQSAVDQDLSELRIIADIKSEVIIKTNNRVEISIKLNKYKGKEDVSFQFLWNGIDESVILTKKI